MDLLIRVHGSLQPSVNFESLALNYWGLYQLDLRNRAVQAENRGNGIRKRLECLSYKRFRPDLILDQLVCSSWAKKRRR